MRWGKLPRRMWTVVPRTEARARAAWLRATRRRLIPLGYPTSARAEPRYGHGRPPHPELAALLDANWDATAQALRTIAGCADSLGRIAARDRDPLEPEWDNYYLPALDGASLYAFAAEGRARRYVEVGSGVSTKFVARARRDHGLELSITSIDPTPREEVDALCDGVERKPLELADLSPFASLAAGDLVFLDGSHRTFPDNDTTTFFLDVLPRLPAGVLVGIHDVMLPDDYDQRQVDQHFSEQYLLAVALLMGGARFRPVLPCWAVWRRPEARAILEPLWSQPALAGVPRSGSAFWFEVAG